MSFIDPDAIPGYREAIAQEQTDRDLALLEMVPICGLPSRQISLRVWMILNRCGNAFITGGVPTMEEVAVFLWFLSPEYCLDEKKRQRWVKKHIRPLKREGKFAWCVMEISAHMKRAFQDSPGGSGRNVKQYVNPGAAVVDYLASEYGWTASEIMNLPIGAVFLYQRAARMRHNPKALMFNDSDSFLSRHLQDRMKQASEMPPMN